MYCLITGTPHHHPSHPDYVPSVFSFTRRKEKRDSRKERFERRMERIVKVQEQKEEEVRQQNKRAEEKEKEEREQREEEECIQREEEQCQREEEEQLEEEQASAQECHQEVALTLVEYSRQEFSKDFGMQTEIPVSDCSQQTDDNLVSEIELLKAENSRLKQSIFSLKLISGNDVSTRFYTGLPSYVVFLHLYTFCHLMSPPLVVYHLTKSVS